ncbi:MAG: hypothetical protein GC159_19970 [Phycisphaera sp.]|nr:hypothetical protein [Phycisphaera sp.]
MCESIATTTTRTRRRDARGFTIVELLVVCSIIVLLLAILVPGMARARYVAKVTVCNANFHQWGVGTMIYASDNMRFFPSQKINRSVGRNMWDVSNAFLPSVIPYGVDWQPHGRSVWYCPLRYHPSQDAKDQNDALKKMRYTDNSFTIFCQMWWVPRPDTTKWFPNAPGSLTGWPLKVTDPMRQDRPILTDILNARVGTGWNVEARGGGHPWQGLVESTTLLYNDGHTEQHYRDEVDVRYSGNWENLY